MKAGRAYAAAGGLRVHAAPNGLGTARTGFALTGMKRAVDRNRVRRRLLAALRPHLAGAAGVDLVVTAGLSAATEPFATLCVDLQACVAHAAARATRPISAPTAPARPGS